MNIITEKLEILYKLHGITKQIYSRGLYHDGYRQDGSIIINPRLKDFDENIPRIYDELNAAANEDEINIWLRKHSVTINSLYSHLNYYPLVYYGLQLYGENLLKDYIEKFKQYELESFIKEIQNIIDEHKARIARAKASQSTEEASQSTEGGKRISKGKSNNVAKKPAVSQKKQSIYKEIFGKQMKIYKMPDSRKEYVRYKGELHPISEYKSLMKQKALAKPKPKPKAKK
jgi:hypothetical protein